MALDLADLDTIRGFIAAMWMGVESYGSAEIFRITSRKQ
jgi:hypothetical protein